MTALRKAGEVKLHAQAAYVVWRDGVVTPKRKVRGAKIDFSAVIDLPDADPGDVTVHRWRRRLCVGIAFTAACWSFTRPARSTVFAAAAPESVSGAFAPADAEDLLLLLALRLPRGAFAPVSRSTVLRFTPSVLAMRRFETSGWSCLSVADDGTVIESGLSQRQAAKVLGVDHATIQRDVAHNAPKSGAQSATGSAKTKARRAAAAKGAVT